MAKRKQPEASSPTENTQPEQKPRPSGLIPFVPGQSGNPAGRPKGARSKFSEAFLNDFLADWEGNGKAAIATVRQERPQDYLRAAVAILPKELNVKVEDLDELDDAQLDKRIAQLAADLKLALGIGEGPGAEETAPGSQSTH